MIGHVDHHIILRLFQDGDPHFPKEILHAMKRGYKILNLSGFRDDSSSSCPWDFTAFVRTFSLYLDDRLHLFLTGKLQRRRHHHHHNPSSSSTSYNNNSNNQNEPVRDMKPSMLLDRISYWQRLLDRAIATRPTGAARPNRLIQICLYAVVQESFDLYRDISDGLALILDSFFHLGYASCVNAFHTCVKASKQFEELCSFYDLCKSVGVGRSSEYPSVQKISDELVETLQEFLKDQSSFPITAAVGVNGGNGGQVPSHLLLPTHSGITSGISKEVEEEEDDSASSGSEKSGRKHGKEGGETRYSDSHSISHSNSISHSHSHSISHSQCTSLEDLFSNADGGPISGMSTPSHNYEQERYSDIGGGDHSKREGDRFADFLSGVMTNNNDDGSVKSDPVWHSAAATAATSPDLLSFVDIMSSLSLPDDQNNTTMSTVPIEVSNNEDDSSGVGWELALIETATSQAPSITTENSNVNDGFTSENDFFSTLSPHTSSSSVTAATATATAIATGGGHYNPFLDDLVSSFDPVVNNTSAATSTTDIDHLFTGSDSFYNSEPLQRTTSSFGYNDNHNTDPLQRTTSYPLQRTTSFGYDDYHNNGIGLQLVTYTGGDDSTTAATATADAVAFPADDFFASLSNANYDGDHDNNVTTTTATQNGGAIDLFSHVNTTTTTTASTANGRAPANFTTNESQPTDLSFPNLTNGGANAIDLFSHVNTFTTTSTANNPAPANFNESQQTDLSTTSAFPNLTNDNVGATPTTSFNPDFSNTIQSHHYHHNHSPPSFTADFTTEETYTTPSNAIVPAVSNNGAAGFVSSRSKLARTPTFQATSDHQDDNAIVGINPIDDDDDDDDPFGSSMIVVHHDHQQQQNRGVMDHQTVLEQQQLWLQNQNKIIAKRLHS